MICFILLIFCLICFIFSIGGNDRIMRICVPPIAIGTIEDAGAFAVRQLTDKVNEAANLPECISEKNELNVCYIANKQPVNKVC